MKKLLISFVLLLTTTSFFAQKNLAVATFDIVGNAVSTEEAEAITELYITELVATGKVSVVDRVNFDKILKEMNFQNSDWSDSNKTTEVGKAVNAEIIARGQIIKLGSKMYLSATIIDVKSARLLSSARKEFNSIDDIFGLLTGFATDAIAGLTVKIGDIGPGGGIVFYIEGKRCLEVSDSLGEATWEEAKKKCSNYRGGGYSDWYLPTREELCYIYYNLREKNLIGGNGWYWSSSSDDDRALVKSFFNYEVNYYYKGSTAYVRAIRAFNN